MRVIMFLVVTFLVLTASAQDVRYVRTAGVYDVGCETPDENDLVQVCFARTDTGFEAELGCTAATLPITEYRMDVTVSQTTFNDAEIRCYVIDDDALVSALSDNKGDIDFTPPGKGLIR